MLKGRNSMALWATSNLKAQNSGAGVTGEKGGCQCLRLLTAENDIESSSVSSSLPIVSPTESMTLLYVQASLSKLMSRELDHR
jgi:hypothetical protein